MALNAGNINAYGFHGTELWLAPLGTTLPTGLYDAPTGDFWSTGYLGSEGITYNVEKSSQEINALQGGDVVKELGGTVKLTFGAVLLEEKKQVLELIHAGQRFGATVTHTDGNFREMDFAKDQNKVLTLAGVLDLVSDTGKKKRYLSTAMSVKSDGELTLANFEDIVRYPVTCTVLAGGLNKFRTDIPGVMLDGATAP